MRGKCHLGRPVFRTAPVSRPAIARSGVGRCLNARPMRTGCGRRALLSSHADLPVRSADPRIAGSAAAGISFRCRGQNRCRLGLWRRPPSGRKSFVEPILENLPLPVLRAAEQFCAQILAIGGVQRGNGHVGPQPGNGQRLPLDPLAAAILAGVPGGVAVFIIIELGQHLPQLHRQPRKILRRHRQFSMPRRKKGPPITDQPLG
jgi:hypothetical protein